MPALTGIRLWLAITGAAVVVALLLWVWRIDSLRAAHLKERDAAVAGLKVSERSLSQCRWYLDENNKQIEARNKALNEAKTKAAADLARANARYEAVRRDVSALEASAQDKTLPACKVSQRALQGLSQL